MVLLLLFRTIQKNIKQIILALMETDRRTRMEVVEYVRRNMGQFFMSGEEFTRSCLCE